MPALAKIRQLSDAAVDELIAALESSPVVAESDEMAIRIAERVSSIELDDLKAILDVVYSIYYVRETVEVGRKRFTRELFETIRDSDDPALAVPADDAPRIRARLEKLLNIETLDTLSKAMKLQTDGERLFCEAKILSDIRPVFGRDIESKPAGAVINHTLKIGYHEGAEHKEFFVVLDRQDLSALSDVVERAKSKASTLDALLEESRLPRLGI